MGVLKKVGLLSPFFFAATECFALGKLIAVRALGLTANRGQFEFKIWLDKALRI